MAGEERDALELLARMLVGGGYKVPVAGRGTAPPLSGPDVAAALAMMPGRLAAKVVHAVATRAGDAEIAQLALAATAPVGSMLRCEGIRVLDLQLPADRHRLRLVVLAAATELVWPERRESPAVLARRAKMRRSGYERVHAVAAGVLSAALNDGRRHFRRCLFGG